MNVGKDNKVKKLISKYYDMSVKTRTSSRDKILDSNTSDYIINVYTWIIFTPKEITEMTPHETNFYCHWKYTNFHGKEKYSYEDATYIRENDMPILEYINGNYNLDNLCEEIGEETAINVVEKSKSQGEVYGETIPLFRKVYDDYRKNDFLSEKTNLQENIRKILREEKDQTKLIKGIIDSSDIFDYKHFCGVDIISPEERTGSFLIKVYFIGRPNSKVWPSTQVIRNKELEIRLEELYEHIKSFVPFNIDIMGVRVNSCDGYERLMKRKYTTDDLQESIRKILREETEPQINTVKQSLQKMVDEDGIEVASEFVGGADNLIKILYNGDIMKYYEETGFRPIRISQEPNLYIDDLIVQKLNLPKNRFMGKDMKDLGEFNWNSAGGTYKLYANLMPIGLNSGQKVWRVVGQSGDYGFGYSYITKRNTLGKRARTQIYNQIIDRFNLNQYL